MRILREKKLRKYRCTIFSLCFFCVLISTNAQENNNEAKDSLQIKKFDDKVNVLMGEQSNSTTLQSISTISGNKLLHRPTFQMEGFMEGILPGLTSQTTQGYASVSSSLNLRGKPLLIVVDGIPRSDANIPASQIESVSVIKDALGLSMMGMSSGNGVMYIKTKRGQDRKIKIDFTAQLAFANQMNRPKFLGAYDYSTLLNEALANDGKAPIYSDRDLELYKSGASPFTHPDVDWYKTLTRKTAPIQQYNLNITGGGKSAHYFIDLNVFDQSGFLKQDKSINSYNTQESFKKYSLRTNVDIALAENTLFRANVFGQMYRENSPGSPLPGGIYRSIHSTPNNAYPVLNPDGTLGGNYIYKDNIYGQSIHSGYTMNPTTDLNIDVILEHKFKNALEGLYVSGTYSYNSTYREELKRAKDLAIYAYWKDPSETRPDNPSDYLLLQSAGIQKNSSNYSRLNRMQYIELAGGYDFSIGNHSSRTKVVYSYNDYLLKGINLPLEKYSINGRTEYDYSQKYLAEFSISAMHLNQLAPGKRWGAFPTAGMGWNLHKEDWFADAMPAFNKVKFRTTYGLNGSDGSGAYYRAASGTLSNYYYTYLPYYKSGGSINIGDASGSQQWLVESNFPVKNTWEKTKRLTIGLDIEAFDNKLVASIEFFNNNFSDMLQYDLARWSNSLIGRTPPLINIGKYRQNGLDLDLSYSNKFGDVEVFGRVNAVFYKTKVLTNGELKYPESYMQRVGQPLGQPFGYVADGLFQSQQEIDEYLATTRISDYIPQPGDIRYKDINGDGILDAKDVKAIGTKAPRIEYGLYLGAEWKGISLSTQWTGLANANREQKDTPFGLNWAAGYGQALEEHLDRWSPENPNAKYPRLSAVSNIYNERSSTYWMKKVSFIRLKNIEMSYTLPNKWVSAMHLSKVKVFANAYNLLTISSIKDKNPEMLTFLSNNQGIIPDIKAFNFGLNVEF